MLELRCQNIIVTGASRGIGLAIAKKLMQMGAKVLLTGRSAKGLADAVRECEPYRPASMVWDLSDFAGCQTYLNKAIGYLGGLDGLVNNAGISTGATGHEFGSGTFDLTEPEWNTVIDTNLKGTYFLMREFARYMLDKKIQGNILNIASEAAYHPATGAYAVSKRGIVELTKGFGKMLAPNKIIVNGIAPGSTYTDMISYYAKNIDESYSRHPLGRYILPEEIADIAAFLMSKSGEVIVGHTVLADAGGSLT